MKWAQLIMALGKIAAALYVKRPESQAQAAVELIKETAKPETQQPPKVAE
jgi:hypothetical protein